MLKGTWTWGVAAILALGATRAMATEIYAVGPFAGLSECNLYRIDPASGAATLTGSTGEASLGGLEFGPTGKLYAYNAGLLFTLDPTTGKSTRIGPLGLNSPEGGLSFHPSTGVLYGVRSIQTDELITINPSNGTATTIGVMGDAARDVSGLAFDAKGTLYGAAFRGPLPDQLVTINTITGLATPVGLLGTNVQGTDDPNVGGLDFDPEHGVLYYSDGDNLYTVNTAIGNATLIGSHGVRNLSGLAVVLPEPTGLALVSLGAIGLLARRVRKTTSRT